MKTVYAYKKKCVRKSVYVYVCIYTCMYADLSVHTQTHRHSADTRTGENLDSSKTSVIHYHLWGMSSRTPTLPTPRRHKNPQMLKSLI